MARVLLSISIFLYLVFSNGWVLDVHYCMNKVSSVHLFETKQETCSRCGMETEESKGCCHEENQVVKLVQDQQRPVFLQYDLTAPAIEELGFFTLDNLSLLYCNLIHTRRPIHGPPLYPSQDIYLMNRVFRI
jgi:hypothetical protein